MDLDSKMDCEDIDLPTMHLDSIHLQSAHQLKEDFIKQKPPMLINPINPSIQDSVESEINAWANAVQNPDSSFHNLYDEINSRKKEKLAARKMRSLPGSDRFGGSRGGGGDMTRSPRGSRGNKHPSNRQARSGAFTNNDRTRVHDADHDLWDMPTNDHFSNSNKNDWDNPSNDPGDDWDAPTSPSTRKSGNGWDAPTSPSTKKSGKDWDAPTSSTKKSGNGWDAPTSPSTKKSGNGWDTSTSPSTKKSGNGWDAPTSSSNNANSNNMNTDWDTPANPGKDSSNNWGNSTHDSENYNHEWNNETSSKNQSFSHGAANSSQNRNYVHGEIVHDDPWDTSNTANVMNSDRRRNDHHYDNPETGNQISDRKTSSQYTDHASSMRTSNLDQKRLQVSDNIVSKDPCDTVDSFENKTSYTNPSIDDQKQLVNDSRTESNHHTHLSHTQKPNYHEDAVVDNSWENEPNARRSNEPMSRNNPKPQQQFDDTHDHSHTLKHDQSAELRPDSAAKGTDVGHRDSWDSSNFSTHQGSSQFRQVNHHQTRQYSTNDMKNLHQPHINPSYARDAETYQRHAVPVQNATSYVPNNRRGLAPINDSYYQPRPDPYYDQSRYQYPQQLQQVGAAYSESYGVPVKAKPFQDRTNYPHSFMGNNSNSMYDPYSAPQVPQARGRSGMQSRQAPAYTTTTAPPSVRNATDQYQTTGDQVNQYPDDPYGAPHVQARGRTGMHAVQVPDYDSSMNPKNVTNWYQSDTNVRDASTSSLRDSQRPQGQVRANTNYDPASFYTPKQQPGFSDLTNPAAPYRQAQDPSTFRSMIPNPLMAARPYPDQNESASGDW